MECKDEATCGCAYAIRLRAELAIVTADRDGLKGMASSIQDIAARLHSERVASAGKQLPDAGAAAPACTHLWYASVNPMLETCGHCGVNREKRNAYLGSESP